MASNTITYKIIIKSWAVWPLYIFCVLRLDKLFGVGWAFRFELEKP